MQRGAMWHKPETRNLQGGRASHLTRERSQHSERYWCSYSLLAWVPLFGLIIGLITGLMLV